jgi:hypothetical protein
MHQAFVPNVWILHTATMPHQVPCNCSIEPRKSNARWRCMIHSHAVHALPAASATLLMTAQGHPHAPVISTTHGCGGRSATHTKLPTIKHSAATIKHSAEGGKTSVLQCQHTQQPRLDLPALTCPSSPPGSRSTRTGGGTHLAEALLTGSHSSRTLSSAYTHTQELLFTQYHTNTARLTVQPHTCRRLCGIVHPMQSQHHIP